MTANPTARARHRLLTVPAAWLLLAATTWGCELGNTLGDVANELANPELESVESGGRRIAEGSYHDIRFDGTAADGAFVVGLRDNRHLAILPFEGSEGCEAGSARSFRGALRRSDDNDKKLDARIPFLTRSTDDEPRELRFTNFACEVDEVRVPNANLPISTRFAKEPGFIVQDRDANVFYVNPWKNERRQLASNAIELRKNKRAVFAEGPNKQEMMWMLAGGQLQVHDRELEQQYRIRAPSGEAFVDFAHTAGSNPMVALTDEAGNVFTASSKDLEDLQEIDSDTCNATFNQGLAGRELIYYSPCSERRLVVYELETDTRREFGQGIARYRITGATETGPLLLYITNQDEDKKNVGTLWARWGDSAAVHLGKRGHLRLSRVTTRQEVEALVNWSNHGGDLLIGRLGQELEKLAENVAHFSSLGIVSEFDGENGKLQRLDAEDGSLELLADSASIRGVRVDGVTERGLFLADFDGTEGDLTLIEGDETRLLSQRVRPGQYQFTALLPMVTVLSDLENGTATLKLHHLERDSVVVVSEGVSEVVEVGWPREGLLYSVPQGERAGVYFAQAF